MKSLIKILLPLFLFSCHGNESESIKSDLYTRHDYSIEIEISNGFYGHATKYILNNFQIDFGDKIDTTISLSRPLALYRISFNKKSDKEGDNKKTRRDTSETHIDINTSDTLYTLTRDFLKSVEFNNVDTNGSIKPIITDDSRASVELIYGGRTLKATISSVNNPTISTNQLDTLLNFVSKFKQH